MCLRQAREWDQMHRRETLIVIEREEREGEGRRAYEREEEGNYGYVGGEGRGETNLQEALFTSELSGTRRRTRKEREASLD